MMTGLHYPQLMNSSRLTSSSLAFALPNKKRPNVVIMSRQHRDREILKIVIIKPRIVEIKVESQALGGKNELTAEVKKQHKHCSADEKIEDGNKKKCSADDKKEDENKASKEEVKKDVNDDKDKEKNKNWTEAAKQQLIKQSLSVDFVKFLWQLFENYY